MKGFAGAPGPTGGFTPGIVGGKLTETRLPSFAPFPVRTGPLYPFRTAYWHGAEAGRWSPPPEPGPLLQSNGVPGVKSPAGLPVLAVVSISIAPATQTASAALWAVWRWSHKFVMSTPRPMKPRRNVAMPIITNITTRPQCLRARRPSPFAVVGA